MMTKFLWCAGLMLATLIVLVLRPSTAKRSVALAAPDTLHAAASPAAGPAATIQSNAVPPAVTPAPPLQSANAALLRFVDKSAAPGQPPRLSPDFLAEVPRLTTPDEIAAVVHVMEDWSDDDTVRHEAINLLRRSNVAGLDARLIALLDRRYEPERIRTFFTQHLGLDLAACGAKPAREPLRTRLALALDDRHLAVRREALSALVEVRDGEALARLARGLDDPALSGMQDLAIYLYQRVDDRQRLAQIRARATAGDQQVRIAAIYVLGEWRDEPSRALFSAAAAAASHALKRAGEMALEKLPQVDGAHPAAPTAF
ncbi:MAG: hypothetical protein H0X38_01955 [Planctomycetes bacterium]|nr:hypothetical protein [Planctomycetota bacterium]